MEGGNLRDADCRLVLFTVNKQIYLILFTVNK